MIKTTEKFRGYSQILLLSAWSFVIVLSSFLFLYIGYWVDKMLNTAPSFMFGLFLLAIMLCVGRLYREAWIIRGNKR
ncbi:MAG: AtpZ/AtpI family protein [Syntrophobacterales bacterium]|jgi:F0F1-type ATP synthase assembly protein I|nr:AtpZ/AtpI family protein [Syntrophobacterales bacterium]